LVECKSENCPMHGSLRTRGAVLNGKVVSTKPKNTAVVEIQRLHRIPKYDRLEKRRSKLSVHVPSCVTVKEGDVISFAECRRVSKTKSHVVVK
jgi:small subunit ribosomal protein S17